jgi:hypothetical protein
MFKILKFIFNFHIWKMRMLNIVLISFICFFIGARLYSIYIVHSVFFNGFHIHHFFFGMVFLSIGGIFGILSQKNKYLELASIFVGGGIGLFADEIGLLLNCTTVNRFCSYAFPGITDIVIVITALIILTIITTGLIERHVRNRTNSLSPADIARETHEKVITDEENNH